VELSNIEGTLEIVREVCENFKNRDLGTVQRIILKLILERQFVKM